MRELIFSQGSMELHDLVLNKRIQDIQDTGETVICNVVTKYDTHNGYHVTADSFTSLELAQNHLKKSFDRISIEWINNSGKDKDFIDQLKKESRYIIENNYAYLDLEGEKISIYVTVTNLVK